MHWQAKRGAVKQKKKEKKDKQRVWEATHLLSLLSAVIEKDHPKSQQTSFEVER